MMVGVDGKPWFDLEPFVDMESLLSKRAKIAAALAAVHHLRYPSLVGAQVNLYDQDLLELADYTKSVMEDPEYEHKDLIKLLGNEQKIHVFLKYMSKAVALNDAIHLRTVRGGRYSNKHLAEHCVDTPAYRYFRFLKDWIDKQHIFRDYGRIVFFINEPGVPSAMHRDYPDGVSRRDNFIWLNIDGRKKFWLWDDDIKEKIDITSRAVIFDNADWHGSEPATYTGWSLRIDGVFSNVFLEKTGLKKWYGR